MKSFKSIAASVLSFLLVAQTLPAAGLPMEAPLNPFSIAIPARLGFVSDEYSPRPGSTGAPDIILLQNLHVNRSVQFAISGILKHLKTQKLLPEQIAVEGATGPISIASMQAYPDAAIRKAASDYLVEQGEMPGAMHFVVTEGQGGLYGVETDEIYKANLEAYQKTYVQRQRLKVELTKLAKALRLLRRDPPLKDKAVLLSKDIEAVTRLIDTKTVPTDLQATLGSVLGSIDRLKQVLPKEVGVSLIDTLSAGTHFYAFAMMRNEDLFNNTLALRQKTDQTTTVLITGGFHTKGLTEECKAKGLSYVVITPNIRKHDAVDERLYTERLLGYHLTREQVTQGLDWSSINQLEPIYPVSNGALNVWPAAIRSATIPVRLKLMAVLFAVLAPFTAMMSGQVRQPAAPAVVAIENQPVTPFTSPDNGLKFIREQRGPDETQLPATWRMRTDVHMPGSPEDPDGHIKDLLIREGIGTYDTSVAIHELIVTRNFREAKAMIKAYHQKDKPSTGPVYGSNMEIAAYPRPQNQAEAPGAFHQFNRGAYYYFNFTRTTGEWTPDWQFWNTITGENAWLLGRIAEYIIASGDRDPELLEMIQTIVNGEAALQDPEAQGGIRFGPQQFHAPDEPDQQLRINSENQASAFSSLRKAAVAAGNQHYADMAEKIWHFMSVADIYNPLTRQMQKGMLNSDTHTFFVDAVWNADRNRWEALPEDATDSGGMWSISAYGVKRIDDRYGKGTAYKMYMSLRARMGRTADFRHATEAQPIIGFDFSDKFPDDQGLAGVEWSVGGRNAAQHLVDAYRDGDEKDVLTGPQIAGLVRDVQTINAFVARPEVSTKYAVGPGMGEDRMGTEEPRNGQTGWGWYSARGDAMAAIWGVFPDDPLYTVRLPAVPNGASSNAPLPQEAAVTASQNAPQAEDTVLASGPSGAPYIGTIGDFSVWADGLFDLSGGARIRITFPVSQAGTKFRLRLMPQGGNPNTPIGLNQTPYTIPASGIVEITIRAADFRLSEARLRTLQQLTILSGSNAFGGLGQDASHRAVFTKIEKISQAGAALSAPEATAAVEPAPAPVPVPVQSPMVASRVAPVDVLELGMDDIQDNAVAYTRIHRLERNESDFILRGTYVQFVLTPNSLSSYRFQHIRLGLNGHSGPNLEKSEGMAWNVGLENGQWVSSDKSVRVSQGPDEVTVLIPVTAIKGQLSNSGAVFEEAWAQTGPLATFRGSDDNEPKVQFHGVVRAINNPYLEKETEAAATRPQVAAQAQSTPQTPAVAAPQEATEVLASHANGPYVGTMGDYAVWADGQFNLPSGTKIRITFPRDQAGTKFRLRLLPESGSPDQPVGVNRTPITIPADGIVEVTIRASDFGLSETELQNLKQISVHSGANGFGSLGQGADKRAAFQKIETVAPARIGLLNIIRSAQRVAMMAFGVVVFNAITTTSSFGSTLPSAIMAHAPIVAQVPGHLGLGAIFAISFTPVTILAAIGILALLAVSIIAIRSNKRIINVLGVSLLVGLLVLVPQLNRSVGNSSPEVAPPTDTSSTPDQTIPQPIAPAELPPAVTPPATSNAPGELIASQTSGSYQGSVGDFAVWADGQFDLPSGTVLRITFPTSQAGTKFRLRLLPDRSQANQPIGANQTIQTVPVNGVFVITIRAQDYGLSETELHDLQQISIHSGANGFGPLPQGAGKHAVFEKIEKASSRIGTASPAAAAAKPVLATAAPQAPAASAQGFRLEFDGPAGTKPDPTQWTYDIGRTGWGNNELENYTNSSENAHLDGQGHLVIHVANNNGNYTSARIKTAGLISAQYGHLEARIKMPGGQGIWPAWWMLGNQFGSIGWPNAGEIDIMENTESRGAGVNFGTIHGPGYSGGNGPSRKYSLPNGQRFSDSFHVFAIDWAPGMIKWYVDGNLYHTETPATLPSGTQWVFDQPFSMVLNVAVGGNFGGNPDSTTKFPRDMVIDYIRYTPLSGAVPATAPQQTVAVPQPRSTARQAPANAPAELIASHAAGPYRGSIGDFAVWADGQFDLPSGAVLRITFPASQAGTKFRLRLLPDRTQADQPFGLNQKIQTVPPGGVFEITIRASDYGLEEAQLRKIEQISIHSGANGFGSLGQDASKEAIFEKIEKVTRRAAVIDLSHPVRSGVLAAMNTSELPLFGRTAAEVTDRLYGSQTGPVSTFAHPGPGFHALSMDQPSVARNILPTISQPGLFHLVAQQAGNEGVLATSPSGRYEGTIGDFAVWADGNFNLPTGTKIRLTFPTEQAGFKFRLRLMPQGGNPDTPVGLNQAPYTIPADGVVEITIRAADFKLRETQLRTLIQMSVHSGANAFGNLNQSADKHAVFEKIEIVNDNRLSAALRLYGIGDYQGVSIEEVMQREYSNKSLIDLASTYFSRLWRPLGKTVAAIVVGLPILGVLSELSSTRASAETLGLAQSQASAVIQAVHQTSLGFAALHLNPAVAIFVIIEILIVSGLLVMIGSVPSNPYSKRDSKPRLISRVMVFAFGAMVASAGFIGLNKYQYLIPTRLANIESNPSITNSDITVNVREDRPVDLRAIDEIFVVFPTSIKDTYARVRVKSEDGKTNEINLGQIERDGSPNFHSLGIAVAYFGLKPEQRKSVHIAFVDENGHPIPVNIVLTIAPAPKKQKAAPGAEQKPKVVSKMTKLLTGAIVAVGLLFGQSHAQTATQQLQVQIEEHPSSASHLEVQSEMSPIKSLVMTSDTNGSKRTISWSLPNSVQKSQYTYVRIPVVGKKGTEVAVQFVEKMPAQDDSAGRIAMTISLVADGENELIVPMALVGPGSFDSITVQVSGKDAKETEAGSTTPRFVDLPPSKLETFNAGKIEVVAGHAAAAQPIPNNSPKPKKETPREILRDLLGDYFEAQSEVQAAESQEGRLNTDTTRGPAYAHLQQASDAIRDFMVSPKGLSAMRAIANDPKEPLYRRKSAQNWLDSVGKKGAKSVPRGTSDSGQASPTYMGEPIKAVMASEYPNTPLIERVQNFIKPILAGTAVVLTAAIGLGHLLSHAASQFGQIGTNLPLQHLSVATAGIPTPHSLLGYVVTLALMASYAFLFRTNRLQEVHATVAELAPKMAGLTTSNPIEKLVNYAKGMFNPGSPENPLSEGAEERLKNKLEEFGTESIQGAA